MAEEYGKNGCDNSLKGRGGAPAATEKAREAILKGGDKSVSSTVKTIANSGGKFNGPGLNKKYEY